MNNQRNKANKITLLDAARPLLFHTGRQWRRASDVHRYANYHQKMSMFC